MTIKQFIEKSIEGGWNPKTTIYSLNSIRGYFEDIIDDVNVFPEVETDGRLLGIRSVAKSGLMATDFREPMIILLDSLAWQAVGKVEGWDKFCEDCYADTKENFPLNKYCRNGMHSERRRSVWQFQMHRMIDALAEGKTISEFLEGI